jgi:hypothetical protein
MPPRVFTSFQRLSARLQRSFGGDNYIWFPATDGAATYTVPIACRQPEDRGDARDLTGMLSMDAGTVTLHAEKADFPFTPDENMIFLLGPSDGAATPAWTAAAVKYQITSLSGPEMFSHYTITARRHG